MWLRTSWLDPFHDGFRLREPLAIGGQGSGHYRSGRSGAPAEGHLAGRSFSRSGKAGSVRTLPSESRACGCASAWRHGPSTLPSLDDLRQSAKCVIDRVVVGKELGDVRINHHDVRTLRISLRVLAADTPSKVIFLQHLWITLHSLHIRAEPRAVRTQLPASAPSSRGSSASLSPGSASRSESRRRSPGWQRARRVLTSSG